VIGARHIDMASERVAIREGAEIAVKGMRDAERIAWALR